MNKIEIKNVSKNFNKTKALKNVSLKLESKENGYPNPYFA